MLLHVFVCPQGEGCAPPPPPWMHPRMHHPHLDAPPPDAPPPVDAPPPPPRPAPLFPPPPLRRLTVNRRAVSVIVLCNLSFHPKQTKLVPLCLCLYILINTCLLGVLNTATSQGKRALPFYLTSTALHSEPVRFTPQQMHCCLSGN